MPNATGVSPWASMAGPRGTFQCLPLHYVSTGTEPCGKERPSKASDHYLAAKTLSGTGMLRAYCPKLLVASRSYLGIATWTDSACGRLNVDTRSVAIESPIVDWSR